jgi:hypothetical protein
MRPLLCAHPTRTSNAAIQHEHLMRPLICEHQISPILHNHLPFIYLFSHSHTLFLFFLFSFSKISQKYFFLFFRKDFQKSFQKITIKKSPYLYKRQTSPTNRPYLYERQTAPIISCEPHISQLIP